MPTELNTPNHRYYQRRYNIALPKEDMSRDFIFASGIAKIDAWSDLLAGRDYSVLGFEPLFVADFDGENYRVQGATTPSFSDAITHTRASMATMVDSDGVLKWGPHNLLTYSEQFDNAAWTKVDATVTANAAVAPDGTTTADQITYTTAPDSRVIESINVSAGEYTFGIWIKGTAGETITLELEPAVNQVTLSADWVLYTLTQTLAAGSTIIRLIRRAGDTALTVYAWGAQVETGDIATDYIATTTAAVSVGPVANLPRLNYPINSDGSVGCPSLLLEPQRTNLVLFSEQMTLWTNGTASVTANATTSPDGYQNADSINNTADVSTFVGASNVAHTFSLFVKQGTSATASIDMSDGATGDVITTFTFATKTFSGTSAGGSWTSPSTAYQDYGNGWYRISLTATKGAGSTIGHKIIASGTGTTFIWGAQLEAGAYATSYIPTLGAAVTRGLDACSKTGISSLIGQTEGTLFVEADLSNVVDPSNIRGILEVNDGTTSNRFSIYRGANDLSLNVIVFTAAAVVANIAASTITGPTKIAVAYNSSDVTVYINGSLIGTDTSVTIPACSDLDLGIITTNTTRILGDGINQALLFKTRLTNAQLAELTTL